MNDFIIWEHEKRAPKDVKPCPICGKRDGLIIGNPARWYSLIKDHGGACLEIVCKRCDLEMREYDHVVGSKKYTDVKKVLIKKWNERSKSYGTEED